MISLHDYLMNNGFSISHNADTGYIKYSAPGAYIFARGSSTQTIFAEEFSVKGESYIDDCRIDAQSFTLSGLNHLTDLHVKGLFVSFESSTVRDFRAANTDRNIDTTMIVHMARSHVTSSRVMFGRNSNYTPDVRIWQSTLELVDLYPTEDAIEISQCVLRHRAYYHTQFPLSVAVPGYMSAYSCITTIDDNLSAKNIPELVLDPNSHASGYVHDAWGNAVRYQQFDDETGKVWLMIDKILAPQSEIDAYLVSAHEDHYNRIPLERYRGLVDYLETHKVVY